MLTGSSPPDKATPLADGPALWHSGREVTVLEALLVRARELDANARRWSVLVLAALAFLHATVVTSFVERGSARAARNDETARLEAVLGEVRGLVPELASIPSTVHKVIDPALQRLVEDLRGDLLRLRATRRSLRRFLAEKNGETPPAGLPAEDDELAGVEPFEVTDVDRTVEIGEARDREELLRALSPLVEQRIVEPRFAAVQQVWTTSVLPRVEAHLDGVAGAVPKLRGRYGEAAEDWQALAESLTALRRAARDLEVRPPERPFWWASEDPPPAGSDETVTLALLPAVVEQLLSPVALDQLRVALERTDDALTTLLQGLEKRRKELADGTDGETLSPGLRRLVRGFPLILGLAMGALLLSAARRRRESGHLVELLLTEGSTPALRSWLSSLERWSPSAGPATRGAKRRLLVLTLGAVAWIGGAAAQLVRPQIVPPNEMAVLAGGGALAVLLAAAYSLAVVRGLRRPREAGPPPPQRATLDGDEPEGEDVLDVHQLKR